MFEPGRPYFRVRLICDGEAVNVCLFASDADDAVARAKETVVPPTMEGATDDNTFDGLGWLVAHVERVR